MMKAIRYILFFSLIIYSAVLLAESQPNVSTAEMIMKKKLEELKKMSAKDIGEQTVTEFFQLDGTPVPKIQSEFVEGERPKPAYTVTYGLTPLKNQENLLELSVAVRWKPNPNVDQTQIIRTKTYFLDEKGNDEPSSDKSK